MINARNLVKIECQFHHGLYPKPISLLGVDEEHKYGITKWEIIRNLTDELPKLIDPIRTDLITDKEGLITVVGNFPEPINKDNTYTILASRISHPKYGEQYEIIYINTTVDLSTIKGVNKFLTQIAHPRQVKALYDTFEEPLKVIADHNVEALMSVKGIGPYLANKLIERYEANKDDSELYIELSEYELTPNMIDKLKTTYGSPKKIIEVLKTNPYQLSYEVDGVGFKIADRIAMSGGVDPKSNQRIAAYIYYMLEDNANDKGNSYLTATEIINGLFDFFGGKNNIYQEITNEEGEVVGSNIQEAINSLASSGIICIEDNPNKGKRRVFLKKIYELESNIARELIRLRDAKSNFKYSDWEYRVKLVEEKQGFNFSDEQKDGIKLGLDSQVCLIHGLAGCVDADTEFFTGTGWKKISEYQEGDMVLQWEVPENRDFSNGAVSLVTPLKYIKEPCNELYHFETKYGISQTVSEDHRIVYVSDKNFLHECKVKDIIDKQANPASGWYGKFITSFNYNGSGIDLTDNEIRLMCAVIADGSFTPYSTNYCRINLKKDRKKERLRELLGLCDIKFTEKVNANSGYSYFYFSSPLKTKVFDKYWYNCSNNQLKIIADEFKYWDGSVGITKNGVERVGISTTIKENADFLQFAFSSTGRRSTISINDRRGRVRVINGQKYITKSIDYTILVTDKVYSRLSTDNRSARVKTIPEKVTSKDGYKYCFSVPSTYLVLRKDDCIFITGNCGKSTLLSGVLGALERYSFAGCSLSGKAAARIQEVTGRKSSTIHKLLGYTAAGGFTHTEDNPLPYDIIILDEVSMIGGEIFLSLLKAIKTGSKLIMLGDTSQLESIGTLNIAKDVYNSSVIPTVNLTQVHRQAAESGILSCSREIRQCRPLFSDDYEGIIPFGKDNDMIFDLAYDSYDFMDRVMQWFKKAYDSELVGKDINNVQLIAPVKERGDCCVYNLNNAIQDYILELKEIKKEKTPHFSVGVGTKAHYIYKGDKVMCIKNDYNVRIDSSDLDDGLTTAIFNGWVGYVTDINESTGTVYLHFPLGDPGEQDVILDFTQARNCLTLGYASTVHKLQGSDCPVVLGVLDFSTPPSMLTCQLLYTLLTRAKKRCILIGQTGAINKATLTDNVCIKKTFLPELLEGKKVILEQKYNLNNKTNNGEESER